MAHRAALLIGAAGVVAAACGGGGGGGGGSGGGVAFRGNLTDVVIAARPSSSPSRLAHWFGIDRVLRFFASSAVAQSSCDADAERLLACAITFAGSGCQEAATACAQADANSCEFSVSIPLTCADEAFVFFVDDVDRDGQPDSGERQAGLVFGCSSDEPDACVFPMCNGDEIEARNVRVEFFSEPQEGDDGTARAEEIRRVKDGGCRTPTPTAAPTATPTPTRTSGLPLPL